MACCHPGKGGSLPMESVAALPWNQRQLSPGIGGRLVMESVAAFVWNGWQLCRGISGRIHLESVAALAWNTQAGDVASPQRGLLGGEEGWDSALAQNRYDPPPGALTSDPRGGSNAAGRGRPWHSYHREEAAGVKESKPTGVNRRWVGTGRIAFACFPIPPV